MVSTAKNADCRPTDHLERSMNSHRHIRLDTPSPAVAMVIWAVAIGFLCAAEGQTFTQPWGIVIPIVDGE